MTRVGKRCFILKYINFESVLLVVYGQETWEWCTGWASVILSVFAVNEPIKMRFIQNKLDYGLYYIFMISLRFLFCFLGTLRLLSFFTLYILSKIFFHVKQIKKLLFHKKTCRGCYKDMGLKLKRIFVSYQKLNRKKVAQLSKKIHKFLNFYSHT